MATLHSALSTSPTVQHSFYMPLACEAAAEVPAILLNQLEAASDGGDKDSFGYGKQSPWIRMMESLGKMAGRCHRIAVLAGRQAAVLSTPVEPDMGSAGFVSDFDTRGFADDAGLLEKLQSVADGAATMAACASRNVNIVLPELGIPYVSSATYGLEVARWLLPMRLERHQVDNFKSLVEASKASAHLSQLFDDLKSSVDGSDPERTVFKAYSQRIDKLEGMVSVREEKAEIERKLEAAKHVEKKKEDNIYYYDPNRVSDDEITRVDSLLSEEFRLKYLTMCFERVAWFIRVHRRWPRPGELMISSAADSSQQISKESCAVPPTTAFHLHDIIRSVDVLSIISSPPAEDASAIPDPWMAPETGISLAAQVAVEGLGR